MIGLIACNSRNHCDSSPSLPEMSELQQFCMSCGGGISHTADQAGTSIFCMHCGQKNQLKSESAQSHSPSPAPSMPGGSAVNEKDNDTDIYLLKNGVQDGPWKRPRITYILGTGQIAPETMVWWEGKDAWGPLNGQTEIVLPRQQQTRSN